MSFFVFLGLSRFGIFPICSGMVRGFSRFVLFLFLGLFRAPMRNSPERVRDTIWTLPEKSGKHPGLETPPVELLSRFAELLLIGILVVCYVTFLQFHPNVAPKPSYPRSFMQSRKLVPNLRCPNRQQFEIQPASDLNRGRKKPIWRRFKGQHD